MSKEVLNMKDYGNFPGGLAVKAPGFHCRGHEFDPWSGN